MIIDKFMTADAAAALIRDGDTVGLIGGGGLIEATCLFSAIERRFLATGFPRNLTLVHSLGIGDRKTKGMNCFAYEGMVKRVIGGHWVWSPRMQELAKNEKIEAYILPGGVIAQLYREIGARRPGLFTHVGLGTVVDPRHGGGKMNARAQEDLVEVAVVEGQEYLRCERRLDSRIVCGCARQHCLRSGGCQPRSLCRRTRRPQFGRQGHRPGPHGGRRGYLAGARGACARGDG
jgi:acyl CoA:acetate/3-ketoacid CoA transferase